MTSFWRNWLNLWCAGVAGFGLVLILAAFPATDGPIRAFLGLLNPDAGAPLAATLRFCLALMGAVSVGWAVTLLAAIRAAVQLGSAGGPVWRLTTLGVVGWFVVDSSLSIATGFGLNAVSNIIFLVAFLVPVLASGVLGQARAVRAAA